MPSTAPRTAALFVTCLVDLVDPDVGEAAVALLREAGVRVEVPGRQVCCGQPAFNAGHPDEARAVARGLLDAFEGHEAVVAPSGSCAGMVRRWFPELFDGTRDAGRARSLAARTHELTGFLVDALGADGPGGHWEGTVTYHDSCHGLRELGVGAQGRRLLASVEGLSLVEMARPDACCGFGGTFSLKLPDVAVAMADDKLEQAAATGTDAIVGGDLGCLVHLAGRAARTGRRQRVLHVATLLAEARGLLPRRAAAGRSG